MIKTMEYMRKQEQEIEKENVRKIFHLLEWCEGCKSAARFCKCHNYIESTEST